MKGTYYKTPIDFKALIEKRDLAKTTLESSIDQHSSYWLPQLGGKFGFIVYSL